MKSHVNTLNRSREEKGWERYCPFREIKKTEVVPCDWPEDKNHLIGFVNKYGYHNRLDRHMDPHGQYKRFHRLKTTMTLTPSKEIFMSLYEEIDVFNRIKLEYKAFELWLLKAKDNDFRKRQEFINMPPSPILSSEENCSQYIGQLEEALDRLRQNNRNLNNKLRQVSNSGSLKKEVSQLNKKGEKQENNKYEKTFITNKIISFANLSSFSDILNSQKLRELSSCISESIETIKKTYGSQITKEDFLVLKRKHVSLDEKRQKLEQKNMYLKENLHQKIEKLEVSSQFAVRRQEIPLGYLRYGFLSPRSSPHFIGLLFFWF